MKSVTPEDVLADLTHWESKKHPLMMKLKERTIEVLRRRSFHVQADRMKRCGLRVGKFAPTRNLCGLTNCCPFCISFRAYRQRLWLQRKALHQTPSFTWLHVTSTVTNTSPECIGLHAQAVITGTQRLFKNRLILAQTAGYFSAVEYKAPTEKPELTMAHVHSIVAVRRIRGKAFVPFTKWQTLWHEVCPSGLGRDLMAKEIVGRVGLRTVANYVTKDCEYDDGHNREGFITRWGERLNEPTRFVTEMKAVSNKWRFFGTLKQPKTYAERVSWTPPWEKL